MVPRRLNLVLVFLALLLPVAVAVLVGLARLLAAMQDASGAAVVDRLALACGTLWTLDLVVLVIVLGLNSLLERDGGE